MKSDFALAFNEILEARALPKEVVIEAIQQALVSAYKRDASLSSNKQNVQATIDGDGAAQILIEKEVVDEPVDTNTEVPFERARELEPDCEIGDMIMVPVEHTSANFGRIAAQTAKQVILQRIREAERESLYDEFIEREGELMNGTVQSVSAAGVTLSLLGRAEAVMPRNHQMPNERYRPHDKIRVYVVEVNKSTRGPQIIVSRAHKDMLHRLLEYEVPEIYNGQVEIKNIAREAGYRSKVAVVALQEGIDPVGACVGMRGMRIQNIIKELNDEKIDVIEWDSDPAKFIAKALSPARVSGVYLNEEIDQMRTATVVVPEDHLSLAIGREGQNARLAAKLTGWRIDIKSVTETALEDFNSIDEAPLSQLKAKHGAILEEVDRILQKKRSNRPVMPEEYNTLVKFVNLAEERKAGYQEELRNERLAMLDTVRPLVPEAAFDMPVEKLELADDIIRALGRIDNVGDLMIRVLSNEEYLMEMLAANNASDDAMEAIKYALDDLVLPEIMSMEQEEESEPELELEAEPVLADATPEEPESEVVVSEPELEVVPESEMMNDASQSEPVAEELPPIDPDEEAPPAFLEPEPEPEPEPAVERKKPKTKTHPPVEPEWDFDEMDSSEDDKQKGDKKSKRRRVQLVYDEDLGEVIAKRRRKGSRRRQEFDDFDFEDVDL